MVGGGLLVSFTILARDQPSRAPIDSTKIQLRLEVIQNTQLPQLVPFFFCQTLLMRNWEFPKGDLISRRVESKKKFVITVYETSLSMYADVARPKWNMLSTFYSNSEWPLEGLIF